MSLKLATLDNTEDFLRMCRSFYEVSPYCPQVPYSEKKLTEFLSLAVHSQYNEALPLLYLENDKVVGMLAACSTSVPFSEEKVAVELAWWVDPEYRGTRNSSDLIHAYEDWAKRIGCKHITMSLLPGLTNPKVEEYYKRMNYTLSELTYLKEL